MSVLPISMKRQEAERGVDELAGEAIEHDIHALAVGGAEEVRLEVEIAGGGEVRVVEAEGAQGVPLAGAGGGEDVGAPVSGELDGGGADAASGGMDEDALPGLQLGEVEQAEVRREEDDGDAGALDEGPAFGHADDEAGVGNGGGAKGRTEEAHDAIAHREAVDGGTDLGDDARAFAAERTRVARVHAEGVEDVAKVEPRGAYGDADLTLGERSQGVGVGDERQAVERALGPRVKTP
jgi:hypothetical protein